MSLSESEKIALMKVLDYKIYVNKKDNPYLRSLSLYSSELKGRSQIANVLDSLRKKGKLADTSGTAVRYFNSLKNQGLISGSKEKPKLTELANFYLDEVDKGADVNFWSGDGGDEVELKVIDGLVTKLMRDEEVSETFKIAWYNAQNFFESVPVSELEVVLGDKNKLLLLFQINSAGWEIARYFRLSEQERAEFEKLFKQIETTDRKTPECATEKAAATYKDAFKQFQTDVRHRISGFLNAFYNISKRLGDSLPILSQNYKTHQKVRLSGAGGRSTDLPKPVTCGPLEYPLQLIISGCPGSGKSYDLSEKLDKADIWFRTQFHSEYSYFDFVGAYKPHPIYENRDEESLLKNGDGSLAESGKPLIDYRFVPGPLMKAMLAALQNPDKNVVLVIEEINRANAAAVLGNFLQLLDRGPDGVSLYPVDASEEQKHFFFKNNLSVDELYFPRNLYLWATMNSADQGVFPLDTAFRRRWDYLYKGFNESCTYKAENSYLEYGGKPYQWDFFRQKINSFLINMGIHEDKLIGPYFLREDQLTNPDAVLYKLFLYLWEDALRFKQQELFLDKSFSEVISTWRKGHGEPLKLTFDESPEDEKAEDESTNGSPEGMN